MEAEQIDDVLKRHWGSKARLAKRLAVTPASVSLALGGTITSARIMAAAAEMARELLAMEAGK